MNQSTLQTILLAILAAATSTLAVRSIVPAGGGILELWPRSNSVEDWEELTDSSRTLTRGDGSITIIEFGDYQCPFCARAQATLRALIAKYPDRVTLLYRHFPLPRHPHSMEAAEAAECAGEQGMFSEFHDLLLAKQESLGMIPWDTLAAAAGVADLYSFHECVDTHRYESRVEGDLDLAAQLGFTGTPAFIINGERMQGARPLDEFERLIQ